LKAKILHGPKPSIIASDSTIPNLSEKKSSHHPPFTQKLYIELPKLEKAYKSYKFIDPLRCPELFFS